MSKTSILAVFALLLALPLRLVAEDPAVGAKAKEPPKVAYGDTLEFWETYTLVVAKVVEAKHHDEGASLVVTDLRCAIQESVPARYPAGKEFQLRFQIDINARPVRDKPGYAVDVGEGDRLMLMMTEEKGKLIHAVPTIPAIPIDWDPLAIIDVKKGSKPIELQFAFRGISSFAMLPGWKLHYPKEDDALVAETVRVCQALSEKDVNKRLQLIAAVQKAKPDDRVQDLMRRRLQATLETALREAQEATRLLNPASKE